MSKKSPFAIQKALKGIGGDPKSVRKLRSGDLLIETASAVQSKSFLMAKTFLDSTLTVTPHKSLNCSRGVISESDLLCASETEILKGLSDQGVTQCQRFGHSQTSCRGQLTCSRCASAGHSSTDCTLEPKCINCLQSHASDSKLCPKWKLEKQIQEIKTNKNISYSEARRLIVPQPSQTYAQITKPTAISTTTQTDPSITKIICPPLQCLSPISSTSSSMPAVSTSSSSAQAHLLPSTSAEIPTIQSKSLLPIPIPTTAPNNNLNTYASSLEIETRPLTTSNKFTALQPSIPLSESATTTPNSELSNTSKVPQIVKQNSKNRKRTKAQKAEIEIKMAKHKPRKSGPIAYTTDDEDMIMYDVQAEELEPNPEDKYAMIECFVTNPSEYMRALTPTRFRKSDDAVQARKKIDDIYEEDVLTEHQYPNWFTKFRSGSFNVEDTPRSGRPVEADKVQ
ncbi:uncharacterized protein TNCV_2465711 [Trichonephila clavipes]|uniref:Mos1 transposase HTH domain-containing protein n=1 Tax=Trichonephila clavipes TaxID=2585209 RepID=A0A8X6UXX1_TRICX|nr:uncharacterized protein TNCV_2465711 [Trichonephila clavipes]